MAPQFFFSTIYQGICPSPSANQRLSLIFLQTYIRGLVGWELAKGTTFPYTKFFVPHTHFLAQMLVKFGGNFFCGKLKGDVRRID